MTISRIKLRPVADQTVVITGATSGIGLASARMLASAGTRVMLIARNEQALQTIVSRIAEQGGIADYAVAEMGDRKAVEAAAARTIECFGGFDAWVNNAGVAIYARLSETPEDEHERLFRTNYFGVVHGSLIALSHLRDKGGTIINMGTIGSEVPSAILGAYTASKHAMRAFTQALRQELIAQDVPVAITLLLPAGVATPLAEHAAVHADGDPQIPVPAYDPEVVARAVVDAVAHPRGDMHVGGRGLATVLAGQHAPGLRDRLGDTTQHTLIDPAARQDHAGNLFMPMDAGRERSHTQTGRRRSTLTTARRSPTAIAAGGAFMTAAGLWAAYRMMKR
ncbi:SDR family oxidoreductase [Croceicoccus hydrothermalis]|uniref:SDR family oxidoreductase n=1 Tax=Croceicoccus hydrothermalis TaxID=2867964 RepID=UPI001EFAAEEB|nr:SDR family oxidoreductase [Croceicoccus hydrothermalis]